MLHIVDLKRSEDPYQDFVNINNELFHYRSDLLNRKMVIALNKIDEDIPQEVIDSFKEKVKDKFDVYEISAKEGKGLYRLNQRLYKLVNESKEAEKKKPLDQIGQERVYSARAMDNGKIPEFQVVRREDGYFEILGERVIRTYKLINIKTDEGMDRLLAYLDRIGVDEKLREAGAKTGDTVILDDFEFEYYE